MALDAQQAAALRLIRCDLDRRALDELAGLDLPPWWVRAKVNLGAMQVYGLEWDGARIGTVALSREKDLGGHWLIVNALAADSCDGRDVTAAIYGQLIALAKATGLTGLRAWTERAGLRRKLEGLGATTKFVLEMRTDGE